MQLCPITRISPGCFIKSHWAESHLELFMLLWLNLGVRGELLINSCLTIDHTRLVCLPSRSSVVNV